MEGLRISSSTDEMVKVMQAERTTIHRVLVVDDDPSLLLALSKGLNLLGGFEVLTASDGATGLERFFVEHPDCVVVDVRMPGLNGYQFVRALRGDPATAQTPIVVLSALVRDQEQLAGLLTGADAYLIKPVKLKDLVQAIHRSVKLTSEDRLYLSQQLLDW
jgi:CheY-like chemotaxis protein